MINIKVDARDTTEWIEQINDVLRGSIAERWGEHVLEVDNEKAKGNIRLITFGWGGSLLLMDIVFFDEVQIEMDASNFNPISFYYCLEGYCGHKYGYQPIDEIEFMEQYHSVILTNRDGGVSNRYYPKDVKLNISVIQVVRKPFLRKRLNQGEHLNKELYRVFMDTDHEKVFAYFGSYNLKIADVMSEMGKIKAKGMIRIMQIEGMVYQILSLHMIQHDKEVSDRRPTTTLLKRELKQVRNFAIKLEKQIARDFTLEEIALETGLTQAKLQEGFKLLYNNTVTEYIRNTRLETARDLIANSEMNISEVVYSIGLSSRSYFSKIFKAKYGISPSDFRTNKRQAAMIAQNS